MKLKRSVTTPVIFLTSLLCGLMHVSAESIADINFNKDWKFHKGAVEEGQALSVNDSSWTEVRLPHDWAIEGPFSIKNNARTGGLPVTDEGWYRKTFEVPSAWKGKRVSVEFDGAMSNAHVWVNGEFVGERPYGYIGFEFDITDALKVGEANTIAVRLKSEDLAMRWYPGSGIYRNVRLKVNSPVHIPQWGTYITTPNVTKAKAFVDVLTTVRNDCVKDREGVLKTVLVAPSGKSIQAKDIAFSIKAGETADLNQGILVESPEMWDLETPVLYKALSTVVVGDKVVDEFETEFGIRTFKATADKGFFLNGRRIELNGVCMHHDLGPLGAAVNYRATERQMQIMQSMGVNALRTSHNPPSPEMLEVCDRLGIVVIVEAFDEWQIGKVPNGYHVHFDEWHERDLRDMIRRDRNHPSVIMWSLGNEILEQGQKDGWKLCKHLNDICHDEDPTRPTTIGFNYFPAPFENKLAFYVDVIGMNYWPLEYKNIKAKYPDLIIYGSETSSQTSTRGKYDLSWSPKEQHDPNYASSYDVIVGPPWAYAPDAEFDVQEDEFVLGEFIWTGFDYLGEPTPYSGRDNHTKGYWNDDWPSRSSYFAPVDLCGFPKDRYYLYQSQWTEEPMVHVLPHWNWEGKEGETIPVVSYTNCEEVELFVNGKSMGKKVKGIDTTELYMEYYTFGKGPFQSKYRLRWDVPYEAGEIKVVAYNHGEAVVEKEIVTAGEPSKIELSVDRDKINADGLDLSFVTVRILDQKGHFCPNADHLIEFEVEGAGELIAVGNGDQTSVASFQASEREAFSGMCLAILQSTEKAGEITLKAKAEGLGTAKVTIITK